uniref:Potassium transporter n=1 Tax=Cryptomeria japonica TaxID=3369 RepID=W8VUU8_CRYJA|nr:potassium transporter [Cryptomeria japonica]
MDHSAEEGGVLETIRVQEDGQCSSNQVPKSSSDEKSIADAYLIQPTKAKIFGTCETILLAYQTLGVVYGDLGTSPLYTYSSIAIENPEEKDLLGILSMIFWTLTMIALVKYVFIVIRADDHGEGGTFALYSLLCRYVNVGQMAGSQFKRLESDSRLRYFSENHGKNLKSKTKQLLENSPILQRVLLIFVVIGTCMVLGDGALTPAISVLSAVQGIQSKGGNLNQDAVVGISAVILLLLFLVQRFGTGKVSFMFSPVMIIWFITNALIGIYNIIKHYPAAFKGLNPYYIVYFFQKQQKGGWVLLGGVVLCITGAEAMFADLGDFNKRSIQIAFTALVYPALIITYTGQAAYLIKNPADMKNAFYASIPNEVYWPMFIIATLSAIVASQALISASFSIIKQSVALGCFPRVKMVHTSKKNEGRIYSPEVNYVLMVICLAIVVGFKGGPEIGNAYGVAVIGVMFITTCLVSLVMLLVWNMHFLFILPFLIIFGFIEGVYLSAVLNKVPQGGWVPFAVSIFFLIIMYSWNYGRQIKYEHLTQRKLSTEDLHMLIASVRSRTPGVCFLCSDLIYGVPPILRHYVKNVGSLHEILIILTIRIVPVTTVLLEERFLVGKLGPKGVYRCLAQYGYNDVTPSVEGEDFLTQVTKSIKYLIINEELKDSINDHPRNPMARDKNLEAEFEELQQLELANRVEAVYVLGKTILRTGIMRGFFSVIIMDIYRFLQNNCRSSISTMKVPPDQLLQVGMVYEI